MKEGRLFNIEDRPDTTFALVANVVIFVTSGLAVADDIASFIAELTPIPSPCDIPDVAIRTVGVIGIICI
jgi:hypothetical protein